MNQLDNGSCGRQDGRQGVRARVCIVVSLWAISWHIGGFAPSSQASSCKPREAMSVPPDF